jgi:crotonobetainyl-CoA:carnitine CoA-transferase CaiB-like acyl-CoA transferase
VDPAATRRTVAAIIGQRTASEWLARFAGKDVCCNVVRSLQEAMADPQFEKRAVFRRSVVGGEDTVPAISVPLDEQFRDRRTELSYPGLGEANEMIDPGGDQT